MNASAQDTLASASAFERDSDDPPFAVYFLLNEGALLYVGSSCRLASRIAQHRSNKVAFSEVRFIACQTNAIMKNEERRLIRELAPPMNGRLHKPQPNRITVRLPSEIIAGLDKAAASVNRTSCGLVQMLIRNHLKTIGFL